MEKSNEYDSCWDCRQLKMPNAGCLFEHFDIKSKRSRIYRRIKFGDKREIVITTDKNAVCPICNVGMGQCHHGGCDWETCPACRNQLIGCLCVCTPA